MKKYNLKTEVLNEYKEYLQSLGYNSKTIYSKLRNIKSFHSYTNKQEQEITTQDIESYILYLKNRKLHSSTMYQYYASVKDYFSYLELTKSIQKNPFHYYIYNQEKQPYKERTILSQEEIQTLYSKTKNLKERIVLHLCYGCGLRAIELERINREDIDLNNKLLIVDQGKNSQRRIIPINETLKKDITQYIEQIERIIPNETALLLNERQKRMKKYTALEILKSLLKRSKIDKEITLHSLRHSIATHLLENGLKLENVKEFLGHKYLDTTEKYTRITKLEL